MEIKYIQPVVVVQMPGLRGPKGDSLGNNIDGGAPDSIYDNLPIADGGTP